MSTDFAKWHRLSGLSSVVKPAYHIVKDNMRLDNAHDLNHLWRVCTRAAEIATDYIVRHQPEVPLNWDVLMAACILHDLVNLPKNSSHRNKASLYSANEAVSHLLVRGIITDNEILDQIHHAIVAHSFSANVESRTIEAKIVQDADRLDALGAIGIARLINVSAQLGRELMDITDPLAMNRPLDENTYGIDHVFTKLIYLPGKLHTVWGRYIGGILMRDMIDILDKTVNQYTCSSITVCPFSGRSLVDKKVSQLLSQRCTIDEVGEAS